MKFEELYIKTGMIGKCRDGKMITFVNIMGDLHYTLNGNTWVFKSNYRDDGTDVINRDYDIVAVYKSAKFDGNTIDFGESVWERPVDWATIKVDTPILVSNNNEVWRKRYFSRYADGIVFAFVDGATSWSSNKVDCTWSYAKLT